MTPLRKKPSLWYLALAAIVLVAGIGGFAWGMVHFVTKIANGSPPIPGPGTSEITLAKPGRYTIYQDYPTGQTRPFDGSTQRPYPICQITSIDGRRQFPALTSAMSSSYSTTNRSGGSMYEFAIDQPGTYRIVSRHADGSNQPTFTLTVSPTFEVFSLAFSMIGSCAGCFGSFVIAAILVIVFLVKRRAAVPPPPPPIPMTPFPPPKAPPSEPGPSAGS